MGRYSDAVWIALTPASYGSESPVTANQDAPRYAWRSDLGCVVAGPTRRIPVCWRPSQIRAKARIGSRPQTVISWHLPGRLPSRHTRFLSHTCHSLPQCGDRSIDVLCAPSYSHHDVHCQRWGWHDCLLFYQWNPQLPKCCGRGRVQKQLWRGGAGSLLHNRRGRVPLHKVRCCAR